jgi:hypothetical protein
VARILYIGVIVALPSASLTPRRYVEGSLFSIGGSSIVLLFSGIHNAWDAVLYIAQGRRPLQAEEPVAPA